jgi:hypothetical protein
LLLLKGSTFWLPWGPHNYKSAHGNIDNILIYYWLLWRNYSLSGYWTNFIDHSQILNLHNFEEVLCSMIFFILISFVKHLQQFYLIYINFNWIYSKKSDIFYGRTLTCE